MQRVPYGKYTKEFREEAVRLVVDGKVSVKEAAHRLSLPPPTLDHWMQLHRDGKLGDVGKTYRPLTDVEIELAKTKKELAEVKMERDIL